MGESTRQGLHISLLFLVLGVTFSIRVYFSLTFLFYRYIPLHHASLFVHLLLYRSSRTSRNLRFLSITYLVIAQDHLK